MGAMRIRFQITLVIDERAEESYSSAELENLLKRTLRAYGVSIWSVWTVRYIEGYGTMKEQSIKDKLSHDQVGYVNRSDKPRERCGNCSMFIGAMVPRCTLVVRPIHPGGWCRKWEPRGGRGAGREEEEEP